MISNLLESLNLGISDQVAIRRCVDHGLVVVEVGPTDEAVYHFADAMLARKQRLGLSKVLQSVVDVVDDRFDGAIEERVTWEGGGGRAGVSNPTRS